jgi:hypothetical protein
MWVSLCWCVCQINRELVEVYIIWGPWNLQIGGRNPTQALQHYKKGCADCGLMTYLLLHLSHIVKNMTPLRFQVLERGPHRLCVLVVMRILPMLLFFLSHGVVFSHSALFLLHLKRECSILDFGSTSVSLVLTSAALTSFDG